MPCVEESTIVLNSPIPLLHSAHRVADDPKWAQQRHNIHHASVASKYNHCVLYLSTTANPHIHLVHSWIPFSLCRFFSPLQFVQFVQLRTRISHLSTPTSPPRAKQANPLDTVLAIRAMAAPFASLAVGAVIASRAICHS